MKTSENTRVFYYPVSDINNCEVFYFIPIVLIFDFFFKQSYMANINNIPLDPTNPFTFQVLEGFLTEMAQYFPDEYLHTGIYKIILCSFNLFYLFYIFLLFYYLIIYLQPRRDNFINILFTFITQVPLI